MQAFSAPAYTHNSALKYCNSQNHEPYSAKRWHLPRWHSGRPYGDDRRSQIPWLSSGKDLLAPAVNERFHFGVYGTADLKSRGVAAPVGLRLHTYMGVCIYVHIYIYMCYPNVPTVWMFEGGVTRSPDSNERATWGFVRLVLRLARRMTQRSW